MQPEEKLFEELLTAEEGTVASNHEKIFVANNTALPVDGQFEPLLDDVFKAAVRRDDNIVRRILKRLIPSYKSNGPVAQKKDAGKIRRGEAKDGRVLTRLIRGERRLEKSKSLTSK